MCSEVKAFWMQEPHWRWHRVISLIVSIPYPGRGGDGFVDPYLRSNGSSPLGTVFRSFWNCIRCPFQIILLTKTADQRSRTTQPYGLDLFDSTLFQKNQPWWPGTLHRNSASLGQFTHQYNEINEVQAYIILTWITFLSRLAKPVLVLLLKFISWWTIGCQSHTIEKSNISKWQSGFLYKRINFVGHTMIWRHGTKEFIEPIWFTRIFSWKNSVQHFTLLRCRTHLRHIPHRGPYKGWKCTTYVSFHSIPLFAHERGAISTMISITKFEKKKWKRTDRRKRVLCAEGSTSHQNILKFYCIVLYFIEFCAQKCSSIKNRGGK